VVVLLCDLEQRLFKPLLHTRRRRWLCSVHPVPTAAVRWSTPLKPVLCHHGFFYRPKITDISEISHIFVGSDKIRYLLIFSCFSYFTQTTQIQPRNNLVLIMFYS
jgi:hypothetical protein